MTLKISVEYGKDNLSEQLNRRYTGVIELGIYQGFKAEPVAGQMKLLISRDSEEVSSAVVKYGEFILFVTDNEDIEIDITPEASEVTKLIVIDAEYQWGVTRPVGYKIINIAEKAEHQLEICRFTMAAVESDSDNFVFDTSSRDIALKIADLPKVIKDGYQKLRNSINDLFGPEAYIENTFKLKAIPTQVIDECDDATDWVSDGNITVSSAALVFGGQTDLSSAEKTLVTTLDLSLRNGLIITIYSDIAESIQFFTEDSQARRNLWNINCTTTETEYELLFDSADVDADCDYSDIQKYGIADLNSVVTYTMPEIKSARFNDFALMAGKAYIAGILADIENDTHYSAHQEVFNSRPGVYPKSATPISPPTSGTRTDYVYLDIYIVGDYNDFAPFISIGVSIDSELVDYVDGEGNQHYLSKIAQIERTTSNLITTEMVTDLRYLFGIDISESQAKEETNVLRAIWSPLRVQQASQKVLDDNFILENTGNARFLRKILALDPEDADYFGKKVAVSGDRIVVSATLKDGTYSRQGAVYLYDGNGKFLKKFVASDPEYDAQLGTALAISGDRIIAGAPIKDVSAGNEGAAYVYDSDGNFITKITASDPEVDALFGNAVAISGEKCVVGAPYKDEGTGNEGAAYIYDTDGNFITKITASDPEANALFGASAAVSRRRIVVGASRKSEGTGNEGAAYIYDTDGNFITKITASDPEANANFGNAVAVSDTRIVAGAWYKKEVIDYEGAAYIYDTDGNFITKITDPEPEQNAYFGCDVAISGDRIIVGSFLKDGTVASCGAVFVFDSEGNYINKIFASDPETSSQYAQTIDISGDKIVVGAHAKDEGGIAPGAAYIYGNATNNLLDIMKARFWKER